MSGKVMAEGVIDKVRKGKESPSKSWEKVVSMEEKVSGGRWLREENWNQW